ncbi:hypothetical protein, partial [Brevibacillus porteri]|uniref:hypothetical protein n=1 Tax=Brevibacillus porteri TaxID=2126350 RepID=UPI003D20DD39
TEKNISRRSDLWSPTERRRDERAKETQRARATKRLPLLRFPANPSERTVSTPSRTKPGA